MICSQEILDNYHRYAMYNIESVEHANIVGLGEGHRDRNSKQLNGRYISQEARKGPVAIFVEGYLSMEKPHISISRLKEMLKIDPDVSDANIQVFGFDCDPDILESGMNHYRQELIEYNQKAEVLLEKRCTLDNELKSYISVLQTILPEFEIDKFESMGLVWFSKVGENYKIFNEYLHLYCSAYKERYAVQKEMESLPYPVPTFIKETLSLRAESMGKTARTVAKLQKEGKLPPLAIFIAGIAHLFPPTSDSAHALQLKAWQDEIAQLKVAVLIEKEVYKKFLEEAV